MTALLEWFDERDVRIVELHATGAGEGLYRSLGFARTDEPAMRRTAF
ncbi:GNAT family N-acetyltransferase [Glycomyces albidus]|nr:hypothetical protein [Glycomyces albidus]